MALLIRLCSPSRVPSCSWHHCNYFINPLFATRHKATRNYSVLFNNIHPEAKAVSAHEKHTCESVVKLQMTCQYHCQHIRVYVWGHVTVLSRHFTAHYLIRTVFTQSMAYSSAEEKQGNIPGDWGHLLPPFQLVQWDIFRWHDSFLFAEVDSNKSEECHSSESYSSEPSWSANRIQGCCSCSLYQKRLSFCSTKISRVY